MTAERIDEKKPNVYHRNPLFSLPRE
jgi:hypothetical protein